MSAQAPRRSAVTGGMPPPGPRRNAVASGMPPQAPLHVESAGAGPPLVLLHGFATHGGWFAPLLPALGAVRRLHVVDLPGHGHSPPLPHLTLDAIVDALDAAFAREPWPLDVLGWSLGGAVALHWAARAPARIARLVLVATTPSFVARDDWPQAMADETLRKFGDELRVAYRLTLQRFLTLQMQGSDEGRATLAAMRHALFARGEPSRAALDAALTLLRSIDLRGELAAIGAPALVIAGGRDTLAPSAAGARLAQALPDARWMEIAGAAHVPFLSHRDAFLGTVARFLTFAGGASDAG